MSKLEDPRQLVLDKEEVLALFCFLSTKIYKECEADMIPYPKY